MHWKKGQIVISANANGPMITQALADGDENVKRRRFSLNAEGKVEVDIVNDDSPSTTDEKEIVRQLGAMLRLKDQEE